MAGIFDENIAKVIKQTDPAFPDYLDFDKLRKEGLEHIGQLAGKIWTDHNVHDPGITILEVLIYALMDLGYKTNLPFQDLVSLEDLTQEDDNFSTPLQILTVNPVTILDYRKLLLEHAGVRNAWIEPATQEITLAITQSNNSLNCGGDEAERVWDCNENRINANIELNGLNKVYIEKEAGVEDDEQLKEDVRKLWSAYRNLCEDLIDITILDPIEFGVCAKVEIGAGFEAAKVYKAILIAIREFIQPQVNYYTLNELLDKGKSMEDIFAGRPYRLNSFGFVDTEEFQDLKRRSAIYLSDLYDVILGVDGVRKIRSIRIDGGMTLNKPSSKWVEGQKIGELQVPVFSLEKSCVDLYRDNGLLNIEKNKIHSTLPFFKKFEMGQDKLDSPVPSGKYRKLLSRYYSIQNDFPVVYGIGEDGLAENTSLTRKTQALQLKGYLMFYDQLLANYTSQLTNIRSLFLLKREADRSLEEKLTYFTQIPETIPGIEKLLKFYKNIDKTTPGTELARPVANDENWQKMLKLLQTDGRAVLYIDNYCGDLEDGLDPFVFASSTVREIYIDQLIESFSHEEYEVSVHSDKYGYFFALHPCLPSDLLLIGSKRHKEYGMAANEARNVAFIASLSETYTLVTSKSENNDPDQHYFGLNYHPVSYLDHIGEIVEDSEEYNRRRQKMLDHLLARFGEDFTDYTLLKYRQKVAPEILQQNTINDESAYLNQFSEISRNRGKAFDYLRPTWNTSNVSGFEKRISLLSGISNYERRNLCNIEVSPCYELLLKDEKGEVLLKGKRSYESEEALIHTADKILNSLKDPSELEELKRIISDYNSDKLKKLFSEKAPEDYIIISKFLHEQKLRDINGNAVVTGKSTRFSSAEAAWEKEADFIENINGENLVSDEGLEKEYRLLPVPGEGKYLDINPFEIEITKHPFWKWQYKAPDSDEKTISEKIFSTNEEAWDDLIETAETGTFISEVTDAVSWKVKVNEVVTLISKRLYRESLEAESSWEIANVRGGKVENYSFETIDEDSFRILLHSEKEVIAVSEDINLEVFDPGSTIKVCVEAFSEENLRPIFLKTDQAYGFQIPANNSFPTLESFHLYRDQKEALEGLQNVWMLGTSKVNFHQYENEESSFGFHLQLDTEVILARHKIRYETGEDRNRAMNSALRYFKKVKPPFSLQKQPNKYTWSLKGELGELIYSDEKFSSNPKAIANFENALLAKATEINSDIFQNNFYHFDVETSPSRYKFIYGRTAETGKFQPLMISKASFPSEEKVKAAYSDFVKEIPKLSFKKIENEDFEFALYKGSRAQPIVVQFQKEGYKASSEEAEAVVNYFQAIYGAEGNLNPDFISGGSGEDQERRFGWKFYKKNDPLAINPYQCPEKQDVLEIKKSICDRVPPIDLRQCPQKEIVVCPEKDPDKYHYQLCFEDKDGLEFILNSFVGYSSEEEALEAWEKEWYGLLQLAKISEEYGPKGKISLEEDYKPADDKACDDASYLAVIPAGNNTKLIEAGKDVVNFYTLMAHLFPIYEVDNDGKKCFKYKVVDLEQGLGNAGCKEMPLEFPKDEFGSLIWLGTGCYNCYPDAIKSYNHFYILAGISQNCRILCDKGRYYVGLIEVLVESFCRYSSQAEAWDDAFASVDTNGQPHHSDDCGDCLPGGVRSFLYASDDPKNFIPVCKDGKWTFKVVEPDYFVATHACSYNSQAERDQALKEWETGLKELNWNEYLKFFTIEEKVPSKNETGIAFLSARINDDEDETGTLCGLVFTIRECLEDCSNTLFTEAESEEEYKEKLARNLKKCLINKYREVDWVDEFLESMEGRIDEILRFVTYFPVYAVDSGHCYRIYWPGNDQEISENGLQPCGCEEESMEEDKACRAKYPFLSSKCFKCCREAIEAFKYLSQLIKNDNYILECTQKSDYGPYSFQILDTSKELGYHPQYYDNYQEILDAIQLTQTCTDNMGMHLLEHILLRPRTLEDCREPGGIDNENDTEDNCLLPICPDYCCPIDWYPDMDPDDPCAEIEPDVIHYLPGSDPYSFWATLVLPSWAKVFRTPDARKAFEQLLYKEVPALVGLNILWLSPRDMCRFEEKFRLWLDWLQDPQALLCDPDGKHPDCRMAECIKDLESELPCSIIPGAGGDCSCEDPAEERDSCCLPPETEGAIFWGYCPPEEVEPELEPNDPVVLLLYSKGKPQEVLFSQIKDDRKSVFMANLDQLADDDLKKTKSYERTLNYLDSIPTINEFSTLVNFFHRYSLKATNNKEVYLGLLQNATMHLLARLVIEYEEEIPDKELESLRKSLNILAENGLTGKELKKSWNPGGLGTLAHSKPLNQINKLLNWKNGK